MVRLQELQLTVAGGSKIISGVSLSPISTKGYMRTSLRCKQESLRMKNSTPRKSPLGSFQPLQESLMEKDDLKCGQNAVVERKIVLVPKSETIVHVLTLGSLKASMVSNIITQFYRDKILDIISNMPDSMHFPH
ncbi:hypothetical protein GOBAR_DD08505 [Gossypium barbadense]|nr:hypothetical protein GOBAR_DD08505 [Gossypium barbadense]